MKFHRLVTTTALSTVCLASGTTLAALLGIGAMLGLPAIVFNSSGFTAYTTASEEFQVEASPLAILFNAGDPPRFIDPVGGVEVVALNILVDSSGMLSGGNPGGHDLLVFGEVDADGDSIIDYSGELLTGEILAFGYQDTGGTTDFFDFRFALTGGELAPYFAAMDIGLSLTVENSTFAGSFAEDFGGNAKGVIGPIPPEGEVGNEGCSQGFWKQPHHFDHWTTYDPDDLFCDIFDCSTTASMVVFDGKTLSDVLWQGGGHLKALGRQAVAALLNAASSVAFPLTVGQVIDLVNDAIASDHYPTINDIKDLLDEYNNLGCPLKNPADLTDDANVGLGDMVIVLSSWGNSETGDINNSGTTDVFDLLQVIMNWGPQPAEWTPNDEEPGNDPYIPGWGSSGPG